LAALCEAFEKTSRSNVGWLRRLVFRDVEVLRSVRGRGTEV
jgi:hypothetical protein